MSTFIDLVDDAAIARAQARVVARVGDELDPRSDRHSGADPRGEDSGTVRIHGSHIGFETGKLYPPAKGLDRRRPGLPGEVAPGRRTVPISTAKDRFAGVASFVGFGIVTNPDHHDRPAQRGSPAEPADGLGGFVRRVLTPGPSPEERLEELLAERRRELDAHAARFDASIADLERREELLRDSRASVERMVRLHTSDLEARESELTDFLRDFGERETRLADAEADLAKRRGELGAVELRSAALETRERTVTAREERIAELESQLDTADAASGSEQSGTGESAQLAFVPGPEYRLVDIAGAGLARGETFALEGEQYVVARTGPSPLPGDRRRCAYLIRRTRGVSSSANP